jgi:hypothetical protein
MSRGDPKPSEAVQTSGGRQHHIDLAPGELAEYILLCVDQARARRVSGLFDEITLARANREFQTYTGSHKGHPICNREQPGFDILMLPKYDMMHENDDSA